MITFKKKPQLKTQATTPPMRLGDFQAALTVKTSLWHTRRDSSAPETVYLIRVGNAFRELVNNYFVPYFVIQWRHKKLLQIAFWQKKLAIEYALGVTRSTLLFHEDKPTMTSCGLFVHKNTILWETIWRQWPICFWKFSTKLLESKCWNQNNFLQTLINL